MQVIATTAAHLRQIAKGPLAINALPTIVDISGPGADQCLQGVLTNDVIRPGLDRLVYGALLTPKGMIVADYWIVRRASGFTLITDRSAHDQTLQQFRRLLPPRLARLTDRTDAWGVVWLVGAESAPPLEAVVGAAPDRGGVIATAVDSQELVVAAPQSARAPFRFLVVGPAAVCDTVVPLLAANGTTIGGEDDLRLARLLAGFPSLGGEIDERTMPSEVDFDALGGVVHDKGCYVGQETVARIHFRGHPNWLLRGLHFEPAARPIDAEIAADGRPAVRVGTVGLLPEGGAIGLGKVRREFAPGSVVQAENQAVTILDLPVPLP